MTVTKLVQMNKPTLNMLLYITEQHMDEIHYGVIHDPESLNSLSWLQFFCVLLGSFVTEGLNPNYVRISYL